MNFPKYVEVAVKLASSASCAAAIVKMVNPPSRSAVNAKKVSPPNRVGVALKNPPNRLAGAVIARRTRPLPVRGLALGQDDGTNGRAMDEAATG